MDPLELDSRRRIYDYVRGHPGAYVREIMAALGMSQGQATYHLDTLEGRGLVVSRKEEYHKRYFAAGQVPKEQRGAARALKARVPRSVLLALLESPGLQHGALAQRVGVRPPTLTYHMKRLEAEALVVRSQEGGGVRYRVADEARLVDALVTYRGSLMDAAVDRFLASWAEMHPAQLARAKPAPEPPAGDAAEPGAGQGEGQAGGGAG